MEQTLAVVGFAVLLASWLAMFARLRRDAKPGVGTLTDYMGPQVPWPRRTGLGLLPVYWRTYGFDARLAGAVLGLILIAAAILAGGRSPD